MKVKQPLWDTRFPASEVRAAFEAACKGISRTEREKLVQIVARQQDIPADVAEKFIAARGSLPPEKTEHGA
jgi:hypothetical protein